MNKIDIHNEVERILKQRQANSKLIARNNLLNACKNQEFSQMYKNINGLELDIARAEFEKKDTSKLVQTYEKAKSEFQKLANQLKIDTTDFNEEKFYVCNLCGDIGYKNGEPCVCRKRLLNDFMLSLYNTNQEQLPSLKNFEPQYFDNHEYGQKLYNFCEKYVNNFPAVPSTLVISGNVGVGKTFISQIIMHELIERNFIVSYFSAFEFSNALKDWCFAKNEDKDDYEKIFFDSDLLIIDDLGTEPIYSNISIKYMQNILDKRNSMNLRTLFTTNFNTDEFLKTYGERIYSRLFFDKNAFSIKIQNSDIRWKINSKRKSIKNNKK